MPWLCWFAMGRPIFILDRTTLHAGCQTEWQEERSWAQMLFFPLSFFLFLHYLLLLVWVYVLVCVPWYTCRGEKITFLLHLCFGSRGGFQLRDFAANIPSETACMPWNFLWTTLAVWPASSGSVPWWTVNTNCEPNNSFLLQAAFVIIFFFSSWKQNLNRSV